jgi:hypothetical protein
VLLSFYDLLGSATTGIATKCAAFGVTLKRLLTVLTDILSSITEIRIAVAAHADAVCLGHAGLATVYACMGVTISDRKRLGAPLAGLDHIHLLTDEFLMSKTRQGIQECLFLPDS